MLPRWMTRLALRLGRGTAVVRSNCTTPPRFDGGGGAAASIGQSARPQSHGTPSRLVLLVGDVLDALEPMAQQLRPDYEVATVVGPCEALAELGRRVPSAVFADFDMCDFRGDALLDIVAREHPLVRRILIVSPGNRSRIGLDIAEIAHVVLLRPATRAELLAAVRGGP